MKLVIKSIESDNIQLKRKYAAFKIQIRCRQILR